MKPKPVKYKNDTSDIMAELSRRLGVRTTDIKIEFQSYWLDVGTIFNSYIGYGFYIEKFCHFLLYMNGIDRHIKYMEKILWKYHKYLSLYLKQKETGNPFYSPLKMEIILNSIADVITRLVLLNCSLKQYENEVLSQYPKKYKPNRVYFDKFIIRLEEFYNIPFSQFPIQIVHPIQEVYVRRMQKQGLLPNPVVYKNKKV